MKTNKIVVGILAHVDAGKTTLAESMLYLGGAIRSFGRVDHQTAFLDTYDLEKQRGITIFSKQAELSFGDLSMTLLDTPGHIDFSGEMERTLQVLDYAILVINSMDAIQGHVSTLWELLKRYQIPVFLFINKMDQSGSDRALLLDTLRSRLDEGCVAFDQEKSDAFFEQLAVCDEEALNSYLEQGVLSAEEITSLIQSRLVFPCYFGSALKMDGVDRLLNGLLHDTRPKRYPLAFGARVFKISRDLQGTRLTYLKITGGDLTVRQLLQGRSKQESPWQDKVDQIRIYSGGQYQTVTAVPAGTICAVTGLSQSWVGEGLGIESSASNTILEPVLTYRVALPLQTDIHGMYKNLCQLEEEEPLLHIVWEEKTSEIHVQVMGEVQIEILKSLILERFGVVVEFCEGSIVYKETIQEAVIGVGHFEPLRHYAEVHLKLEPMAPGSGLIFMSDCQEDDLDRSWQRLVMTHLAERKHRGVLTGAEITDLKITLIAGRAHQKHTEGGDFRQATYRAVRQGLKKAQSLLLEPIYRFILEVPADKVGRALSDLQKMAADFQPPHLHGELAVVTGTVSVFEMRSYQTEVLIYTRGQGKLFLTPAGYAPCHQTEVIVDASGYDSEADLDHPTASVFCAHGAGFVVPWNQVEDYMHIEHKNLMEQPKMTEMNTLTERASHLEKSATEASDDELEAIFIRTYGPIERRSFQSVALPSVKKTEKEYVFKKRERPAEYLLVDGYNIIFAWPLLRDIAQINMAGARDKLCEILCNYQGYKNNTVILVFDAYKVTRGNSETQSYYNIHVVYTKQAETADQYIEKTVHQIGRKYQVTVATSDALEQMIIWGLGATRLSAEGLKQEIESANQEIRTEYLEKGKGLKNQVLSEAHLKEMNLNGEGS